MSGLVHIYCGEGKGKTTAALGLIIRALASGYQVVFAQFMKSWDTGELEILRGLNHIRVLRGDFPSKFSKDYTLEEREAVYAENNRLFAEAVGKIDPSVQTLLVLDEINGCLDKKLMDETIVLNYLKNKSMNTEVVLTGRNPLSECVQMADYVTEMKNVKHPYDKGIMARKGIEY